MDFYNDFNLYDYRKEREKYGHFLKVLSLQLASVLVTLLLQLYGQITVESAFLSTIIGTFATYIGVMAGYVRSKWRENEEIVSVCNEPLQYSYDV